MPSPTLKTLAVVFAAAVTLTIAACGGSDATSTAPPRPTATAAPAPTSPLSPTAADTTEATPQPFGWEQLSDGGPPARRDATLVHDSANGALLLFGGRAGGEGLDDLWSYDLASGAWSEVDVSGPDARWGHTAIFDSRRAQMVVFSGQRSGGFFNDVWVYDTASRRWEESDPSGDVPELRYGSCAGYDNRNDRFYISHGFSAQGRFDDTWYFDLAASTWTDVSADGPRPLKRCLHQCAFDQESGDLLLFGGQSNQVPILGDLWRYNAESNSWTEAQPSGDKPAPRNFSSFDANPGLQLFYTFGGRTPDGRTNDAWRYDQARGWLELAPAGNPPMPRMGHASTLLPDTRDLYVFGGTDQGEFGDLWRLNLG